MSCLLASSEQGVTGEGNRLVCGARSGGQLLDDEAMVSSLDGFSPQLRRHPVYHSPLIRQMQDPATPMPADATDGISRG